MKKSRTAGPSVVVASPAVRSLPLVALLVDTKAELLELMVRSGLRVLDAMLEADRTVLCGPRYAHQPERTASRAGTVPSEVVLGGRKVAPCHGPGSAPTGVRFRCRRSRPWPTPIR